MSKLDIKFTRLTPFKRCVIQNFPFIEEDFDALTNYGLLCKIVEYLNNVINSQNEVQGVTEEIVTAFNNLYDYVHDYFENLDVQDEINNKLDEMTEQGQLADIISQYLNSTAVFGYNNLSDMKNAENLVNGSYARTMGYYAKNDGGGALYKIRTVTNDDVIDEGFIVAMNDAQNQLVAELIIENNEVNVKQFGAYGDGTHDDTTAISNSLSKGGNVHLPSGSYKLTSKINLSNITANIYGDGSVGGRGGATAYVPSTTIISPTNEFAFKTAYPKRNYFTHLRFDGKGIDELAGGVYECDFLGSVGIYYLRGRCDKCYFGCSGTGINTSIDSVITNCTFGDCGTAISLHGSDNRIINNRIDWNNLGIELTSASYNTIEGNIFDRNTTYGITIDNGCHHNNITGNLFERNLINHIKGALYDVTLNSNKFVKKIIIDGDETSDVLPTTAFDFSDFFNSSLVGNEIYADKVNKTTIQLSNTSSAVGNIVNNKNTDFIYTKLGDLTVGANTVGVLDVQWSAIKANILNLPNGANFSLANIEVRDGNIRNYIGSDIITDLNYDPYWNIQVVVNNNTSSSKTYNIYAKFDQINIFKLDFTS